MVRELKTMRNVYHREKKQLGNRKLQKHQHKKKLRKEQLSLTLHPTPVVLAVNQKAQLVQLRKFIKLHNESSLSCSKFHTRKV